jgi:hypothetical protein
VTDQATYEGWAILELMGHRRLAGYVREQEIAGAAFLRLDVPGDPITNIDVESGTTTAATQFYSPQAVYCLTPTTEDTARVVAKLGQPAPVQRWELPAPRQPHLSEADTFDPDDGDDDDDDPEMPF